MCAAMGADWIGLNFHPVSPRFVESVRAAEIVEALPASTQAVGLFVDRPVEEIKRLAHDVGFRIVQLHGNELPESYLALAEFTLIRAYRIGSPQAVDAMLADLDRAKTLGRVPDAVLVDDLQERGVGGAAGVRAHNGDGASDATPTRMRGPYPNARPIHPACDVEAHTAGMAGGMGWRVGGQAACSTGFGWGLVSLA